MHDRLPDLDVIKRWLTLVHDHEGKRRVHLPALCRHLNVGQGAQALDLDVIDIAAAQHVDIALFERHGA